MNVRIFWVRAMKCMCAQTRPRFILSVLLRWLFSQLLSSLHAFRSWPGTQWRWRWMRWCTSACRTPRPPSTTWRTPPGPPSCWPPPPCATCWAPRTWPRSCRTERPSPTSCRWGECGGEGEVGNMLGTKNLAEILSDREAISHFMQVGGMWRGGGGGEHAGHQEPGRDPVRQRGLQPLHAGGLEGGGGRGGRNGGVGRGGERRNVVMVDGGGGGGAGRGGGENVLGTKNLAEILSDREAISHFLQVWGAGREGVVCGDVGGGGNMLGTKNLAEILSDREAISHFMQMGLRGGGGGGMWWWWWVGNMLGTKNLAEILSDREAISHFMQMGLRGGGGGGCLRGCWGRGCGGGGEWGGGNMLGTKNLAKILSDRKAISHFSLMYIAEETARNDNLSCCCCKWW